MPQCFYGDLVLAVVSLVGLSGRQLSYAFGGILMLDEEQEGLGLSPLKSGPKRLGNHMFLSRGLMNKFGYILPYYEDHLCVLLWRNPKDMGVGGEAGFSDSVYSCYLLCKKRRS